MCVCVCDSLDDGVCVRVCVCDSLDDGAHGPSLGGGHDS